MTLRSAHGGGERVIRAPNHLGDVVMALPALAEDGGDVLVVIEAMKVLHSLSSSGPGVVADVRIAPGDTVESQQILITFEVDQ